MDEELRQLRQKFEEYHHVRGYLVQCCKCGRYVLVEGVFSGSDDDLRLVISCWDCLDDKTKGRAKKLYGIES